MNTLRTKGHSAEAIAIFGGTFDPIHKGHILLIETVIEQFKIKNCIVIPCKKSPHKENCPKASDQHRLAMCKLALDHLKNAHVSDIELTRKSSPSFSWMTVEQIKKTYPNADIHWILGTDQWDKIESWERFNFLAKNLTFIVVERQNEITKKDDLNYLSVSFNSPISSTKIRKTLLTEKTSSDLPTTVMQYIIKNQLYEVTI